MRMRILVHMYKDERHKGRVSFVCDGRKGCWLDSCLSSIHFFPVHCIIWHLCLICMYECIVWNPYLDMHMCVFILYTNTYDYNAYFYWYYYMYWLWNKYIQKTKITNYYYACTLFSSAFLFQYIAITDERCSMKSFSAWIRVFMKTCRSYRNFSTIPEIRDFWTLLNSSCAKEGLHTLFLYIH